MGVTPSFNYIPGSGLVAPLFSFEVNSGGEPDSETTLVLTGHATDEGAIEANTPTPCSSQQQADALCGPGSMLREMFRVAQQNAPAQQISLLAVAASGAAAQWTLTLVQWTGSGIAVLQFDQEIIQIAVSPSDTPATLAANIVAAINAYYNSLTGAMLPFTAAQGTDDDANVVTLTARHAGVIFNDLDIYVPSNYQGNVLQQSGILTVAQSVEGTGTPTLATALAALGDGPADFIVSPWSDSDSTAAYAELTNDVSGRWSWSRQSYGHVWAASMPGGGSFSSLTTLGLSLNDRHLTVLGRPANTPSLAYLWASAFAAREAPWLSDCTTGNVSRNMTGLGVQGVGGPRSSADWWSYSSRNTLLSSGISTFTIGPSGIVQVDKTITTYQLGLSGQPDATFRDINSVYQVAGGLSYIRDVLATEQGQKGLANSNPSSLLAITTIKDITATFIHAYQRLCANGVFDDASTFSSLLSVVRNSGNPARVDVYCPMERVNPLDLIAANAMIYAAYPTAAAA